MSDTNQIKSASGGESVGAALQAATVLGASDGLISENQEVEARDREDALTELSSEQWETYSESSEAEEAQEEGSGTVKTGRAAGVVSPAATRGAAATAGNAAISSDVAAAGSSPTGASGAGGDAGVSGGADDADEENSEEESDEAEEEDAEEDIEESQDSSDIEEEIVSEPDSDTVAAITTSSESSRSFEPTVIEQPTFNANYAPEAVPDDIAVSESGTLLFDPLANDKDMDVNDHSENFSLDNVTIVDSNGDSVSGQGSVSIVDNQLQFSSGSDFESLAAGEEQAVTVRYVMSDDEGAQSSSIVEITVAGENDIPVAVADTATGSENQVLLIDVLANDSDADHDDTSDNFTLGSVSVVDANGNLVTGQGSAGIVNNQLQFTPGADFDGLAAGEIETVTVRYVMNDDEGAISESQVILTVTGANDEPVPGETILLGSSGEDSLIEITEATLLANASDVDGDQLSVQNLGSNQGIVEDNGNGLWSFTPNSHFSGTADFFFDVFDGATAAPAHASILLTGVADDPMLVVTSVHNDVTIADHNFDSGSEGWTQQWMGTQLFASGNMLGSFEGSGDNPGISRSYDVPQGVGELTLNFTFYEVDSWDGEAFRVFVDGQLYHQRSYHVDNHHGDGAGAETLTNSQGEVIGQVVHDESLHAVASDSWVDQAHHYTLTIPVDPGAGQVSIGFGSTLDEVRSNESWGIDNLNLTVSGSVSAAMGLEDTAIALDVAAVLADTDGSESLAIKITDVPEGAVISAGEQNSDGSWSLVGSDLENLEITPPLHFNGEIHLTVVATSTETATGETASIAETLMINVLPVNDPPSALAAPAELSHTVHTQPTGNGSTFVTLNEHANDFGGLETGAISLWMKLDSGQGSGTLLSMADSSTRATQSFLIAGNTTRSMSDESLTFAAMDGSTHFSMMVREGQDYLLDDQWHHITVVVDGIDNRMYIDGERADVHFKNGSATTNLFTGTDIDLVNIGSLVRNGDLNGTLTAQGEIAEVAIFDNPGSLNDSSIKALMNQGPDYFSQPAEDSDLLFSTDFAGTGDTVIDTSGNGRDGTAFSGNLATRGSFTVIAEVAEDDTLILQEADLLNGFSDLEGDSLSIPSISADHGTVVNQGDGHWLFTPDNDFHGVARFSVEVTDGTDTVTTIRTVTVTSINGAPGPEISLNIESSTFQIMDGVLLGTELSGKIVESNGFTSLDQWLLDHQGGTLSVSLNTADGNGWAAGVRLLHSDANGAAGAEVAWFSSQLSETGQTLQVLEFDDLAAGHYQLVLGNDGFDPGSAGSALDYPGVVSGEHSYEVAVAGQVSVSGLPRDPEENALIAGESWSQTEGILTLAVVNNESEMIDADSTLHYEVFNDDVRVGQGMLDFSGGVSPQNVSITINNEPLETLTLDEVQVVFHEINVAGEVVSSQTFDFDQAAIPEGGTVTARGGDGLQGLELMELGLDYFDLGFSELMDDMQGAG